MLSQLAQQHPLPAKIIEYRQQAKLKNTYVDALPALVHPETGRVHTSFKQDVAATGRLSSTDPNLQNIPVRTRDGREIRAAFIPGHAGWQLLCADYSQIELRVLAHFSRDEALVACFCRRRDIHAQVASEVYGVPLAEVTAEMRRAAKAINFGVIYGQSPFGLAKSLSIEKSEAAAFIDAYFERYPGVDKFMEKILAECQKNGYVSTALGRRRAIQGVATLRASRRITSTEPTGTHRDQHGHPGHGGGPDQASDDSSPSADAAREAAGADVAANPRRIGVRSALGRTGHPCRAGGGGNVGRWRAVRAAESGRESGSELGRVRAVRAIAPTVLTAGESGESDCWSCGD